MIDHLQQQFIAVTNRLKNELVALRQSVDAFRNQQERHYQQEQTQKELPQASLRVEAETHEAPCAEIKTTAYQKKQFWVQLVTAIATSLAFLAAAIYAGIAEKQLREMVFARSQVERAIKAAGRSADAAELANSDSAEHFVQDERPYLGLNLTLEPPPGAKATASNKGSYIYVADIPNDPNYVRILWSIHFKNYGKSPAVHVRFDRHMELGINAFQRWHWGETTGAGDTLPPTADQYITIGSEKILKSGLDSILKSDNQMVIFGHFDYEGLGGGSYWTEFCISFLASGSNSMCPTHNLME